MCKWKINVCPERIQETRSCIYVCMMFVVGWRSSTVECYTTFFVDHKFTCKISLKWCPSILLITYSEIPFTRRATWPIFKKRIMLQQCKYFDSWNVCRRVSIISINLTQGLFLDLFQNGKIFSLFIIFIFAKNYFWFNYFYSYVFLVLFCFVFSYFTYYLFFRIFHSFIFSVLILTLPFKKFFF